MHSNHILCYILHIIYIYICTFGVAVGEEDGDGGPAHIYIYILCMHE